MNPMMAAAMMNQGGGEISKSLKLLLVAIAVALLAFFGWRAYKKWKDEKETAERNKLDTSITSQQVIDAQSGKTKLSQSQLDEYYKVNGRMLAARLRNAFNPSGIPWLIVTDTTNNKEVKTIAEKIKAEKIPFKYIANAYYDNYKDDLNDRLRSELSTSELRDFYSRSGLQGLGFINPFRNVDMARI
jgi:hypothetical protein